MTSMPIVAVEPSLFCCPEQDDRRGTVQYTECSGDWGLNLGSGAMYGSNSFEGKAVLIERGVCAFSKKVLNAYAAGAAAVIVYNNNQYQLPITMGWEYEYGYYRPGTRLNK